MNRNPVGWFEIYVNDIERARRFYEGVFSFKMEKMQDVGHPMYAFPSSGPQAPGVTGSIVHIPEVPAGKNSVLIYFSSQDCTTEESKVAQYGGQIFKSKFSIKPYGFISLIADSEGNMIGLHSMV